MQKNKVIIPADKEYKIEELHLLKVAKTVFYENYKTKKRIPTNGLICHLKTSLVQRIFFDITNGTTTVQVDVDLDKLEAFVKKAKKARIKFRKWEKKRKKERKPKMRRIFFRHLSPDISFMFRY